MAPTASSVKPQLSYSISYGFLGGRAHSRHLRKLLHQQGYIQAASPDQADIVIAHSAGCCLVPPTATPQLVIFIGLPLAQTQPHQTFKTAHRENIRAFLRSFHLVQAVAIGFYSLYYGLTQPRRNRNIVRDAKKAQATIFPGAKTVFIANRHDPWPRSEQLQDYLATKTWAFLSLPGSHDDIWEHPERYVAIINYYARLLA